MLRIHELSVGLFTHFDPVDGVAASLQISNLGGGVLGSVVENRHGKQQRQSICQTAPEDKIKAGLFGLTVAVDFAMPGICGRNIDNCLAISVGCVVNHILESAAAIDRA